jgi:hypothetical protein
MCLLVSVYNTFSCVNLRASLNKTSSHKYEYGLLQIQQLKYICMICVNAK